jgi:hypothetical protein
MKFINFFIFSFIIFKFSAQYTEQSFHLSARFSAGKVDTAFYQNYSIAGEIILENRLGLNYSFDFVHRNDNINQFHAPAGLLGGPLLMGLGIASWLAAGDDDGDGEKDANFGGLGILGGLLVLALPDGVSYHFPIKYNWDIAPYANVLGIDRVWNNNTGNKYWRYAASFGTKVTYWQPSNLTFNGFFETRKVAGMGWSIGGGVGIGYTFE